MIRALEGVVQDFDRDSLTAAVVVGGVHHEIRIPAFASDWAEEMEGLGQLVLVHVYEYASQHDITSQLVGFPSSQERDFFRKFVEVPKVGPSRATQALEKYNIEKDIAAFIKKEFDKKYNPTWHAVVGRNFGSSAPAAAIEYTAMCDVVRMS